MNKNMNNIQIIQMEMKIFHSNRSPKLTLHGCQYEGGNEDRFAEAITLVHKSNGNLT